MNITQLYKTCISHRYIKHEYHTQLYKSERILSSIAAAISTGSLRPTWASK